jgi:hypothetical protein
MTFPVDSDVDNSDVDAAVIVLHKKTKKNRNRPEKRPAQITLGGEDEDEEGVSECTALLLY